MRKLVNLLRMSRFLHNQLLDQEGQVRPRLVTASWHKQCLDGRIEVLCVTRELSFPLLYVSHVDHLRGQGGECFGNYDYSLF